jgi:UDP-N-acetylmuramate: L-alanyl-gamma-D-glutamyl-meso-diaminopimelate ligase
MTRLELDPALNFLPESVKTIHMIGICGTGMAALAGMLKEKGFDLTGSDANVYPPMSDFLVSLDIPVMSPYDPANLDHRPDLVVVGNVVTRENPETPRLKELGLPYLSLPQTMKMLFLKDKKPLVAAGTHGKTTTSTLAAWLLESVGKDPWFFLSAASPAISTATTNSAMATGLWWKGTNTTPPFSTRCPSLFITRLLWAP